jgi:hypothetical protein
VGTRASTATARHLCYNSTECKFLFRAQRPIIRNIFRGQPMSIKPDQMIAYLDDHLPYERMMLEYTFGKISAEQSTCDWNAYYESFAVHARNLYKFLGNEDDVRACDFVPGFSAAKSDETKRTFPDLLKQVLHLSQVRPSAAEQKVQLDDAREFHAWLDKHFSDFLGKLPLAHKKHWNAERSVSPKDILTISTGPTGPVDPYYGRTPAIGPSTSIQVNSTAPTATNHVRTSND